MGDHSFQFILYNLGLAVTAVYKGKACLLIVCVFLIGCQNEKQLGADNLVESTALSTPPLTITLTATLRTVTTTPTTTNPPTATTQLLPTITPTPQASPVPTSTPLPTLVWAEGIEHIANLSGVSSNNIVWSPLANEYIFDDCWVGLYGEISQQSIFMATAPDFSPVNITPTDFSCEFPQDLIWSPNAEHILFAGPFPDDHPLHPSNYGYDNSAIWIMDRTGSDSHPLNLDEATGRWVEFIDWIDEQTLVYKAYAGGGHHYTAMLDVDTGVPISWAVVHIGGGYQPGLSYIGTNVGMNFNVNISAVAVSKTMLNRDTNFDGGPFLLCLSQFCHGNPPDKPPLLESNSRFEDWLPGTNKMLILTWGGSLTEFDEDYPLEYHLNRDIVTQLQLWDVDAYEVSALVPQGIYGRFSPDGQYLAYHTYLGTSTNNEYDTQLNILRLADKQVILSLPSTELIIDYENIPGFVWSPTSDRLIYQDRQDNWQVLHLPEGNQTPITYNGGARLSLPLWSSDGQYLSLTVRSEAERGIVILQIP
jgi:hypothetical protein